MRHSSWRAWCLGMAVLMAVLCIMGGSMAATHAPEVMFVTTGGSGMSPLSSCLTARNNSNDPGTPILLANCSGSAAQRWVRVLNHTDDQGADWYRVKKANTEMCWAMLSADSDSSPGTPLVVQNCTDVPGHLYTFHAQQDNRYEIQAMHAPGMCLSMGAPAGATNETSLQLWECGTTTRTFNLTLLGPVGSLYGWGISLPVADQPTDVTLTDSVWKVQTGRRDTMVVLANGTLAVWGTFFSQVPPPRNVTETVMDIAAGYFHGVALLFNGSIITFGYETSTAPILTQPAVLTSAKVTQVAAGPLHNLVLLDTGRVIAFGANETGQSSVPPEALSNVVSIAAGAFTSMAIKANGSVIQWGSISTLPTAIQQEGALAAVPGWDQCIALLPNHTVVMWTAGPQLYPTITEKLLTVPAEATGNVQAITARDNTSLALLESGEVVAWGAPDPTVLNVPEEGRSGVIAMATAGNHTVILRSSTAPPLPPPSPTPPTPPFPDGPPGTSGYLVSWGANAPELPLELTSGNHVWKVSAGARHLLVLLKNGTVCAYGNDDVGQATVPEEAKSGVIDIDAGQFHSLAIRTDGTVVAWGANSRAQATVPVSLRGLRVKQIAGGYRHSLALVEDGRVLAWGSTVDYQQASVPLDLLSRNVTAIAAGVWASMAILDGGKSIVQWGSYSNLPSEIESQGVMPGTHSLALGLDHVTGLLPSGRVVVWPAAGQAPAFRDALAAVMVVPDQALSNVIAVSARENISMALLTTGEVVAWGKPADPGTLQVPDAAKSGVIAVAAGGNFGVAIKVGAPSAPLPPPSPPPAGPTSSTNITFTLSVVANAALASISSELSEFGSQLQAALAAFFAVPTSQVQVTLQAPVSQRRLLQSGPTTTLQVAAQVTASWATSDTATRDALRQRVTQLSQGSDSLAASLMTIFPTAMVQQYGIQQVSLQGPVSTTPGTLFDVSPLAPPSPGPAPSTSSGSKAGIIAGVAAAAAALLAAAAGAVWWWRRSKRAAPPAADVHAPKDAWPEASKQFTTQDSTSLISPRVPPTGLLMTPSMLPSETSGPITARPATQVAAIRLQPSGIMPGDPFLHTATQLTWTDYTPGPHTVRVEAGINDTQLDTQATEVGCPAIEMTHTDFKQDIELLTCGLVGKGGAALVFMCRWPSRFGPDALLAAKVLKNAYDASPSILRSFAYEAKLLASIGHDHVVRLYGYCLELPTVCLIMELLPGSLEDLLYKPSRMQRLGLQYAGESLALNTTLSASPSEDRPTRTTASVKAKLRPDSQVTLVTGHNAASPADTATALTCYTLGSASEDARCEVSLHTEAWGSAAATSASPAQRLSMVQVLRVCVDVAAGLAYLHNRQLGAAATASLVASMAVASMAGAAQQSSTVAEDAESVEADTRQAQSAKVVHRDLKPANILLNSRGQAKISDFGLARENATTTVHTVHVGAGTLHYMAPELLANRNPYLLPTNRVDIYSLGIMMWEMVAGKKPWSGLNPMQLQMAVNAKKRPDIPDADDEEEHGQADLTSMPASFYAVPGFVDLVRACWRQRDHKRPPASEVHDKLCAMLSHATSDGQIALER